MVVKALLIVSISARTAYGIHDGADGCTLGAECTERSAAGSET